jgi:hypothetical protein
VHPRDDDDWFGIPATWGRVRLIVFMFCKPLAVSVLLDRWCDADPTRSLLTITGEKCLDK